MRDWRHNNNVHYFGSCGAYDVHLANLYFHAIYVVYVGDMGGNGMMFDVTVSLRKCLRTILLCHSIYINKRIILKIKLAKLLKTLFYEQLLLY